MCPPPPRGARPQAALPGPSAGCLLRAARPAPRARMPPHALPALLRRARPPQPAGAAYRESGTFTHRGEQGSALMAGGQLGGACQRWPGRKVRQPGHACVPSSTRPQLGPAAPPGGTHLPLPTPSPCTQAAAPAASATPPHPQAACPACPAGRAWAARPTWKRASASAATTAAAAALPGSTYPLGRPMDSVAPSSWTCEAGGPVRRGQRRGGQHGRQQQLDAPRQSVEEQAAGRATSSSCTRETGPPVPAARRPPAAAHPTDGPPPCRAAHLAVELQRGGGHLRGAQLHKRILALGVHADSHHGVRPCAGRRAGESASAAAAGRPAGAHAHRSPCATLEPSPATQRLPHRPWPCLGRLPPWWS